MKGIPLVLLLPGLLFSQTLIYRSVQENKTTAVATNTIGTLTISGSTATFSAALPDTIGVGDIIEYDVTDNGVPDNIAVIHGRTSSTVFTVKDSLGGTSGLNAVTNDNAWNIFRAYTTLALWQSRTENTGLTNAIEDFDTGASRNIVTANEQWHVAFYGQNQSGGPTIDPGVWTTGTGTSGNYIRIYAPSLTNEVGTSQRHSGTATATKVRVIFNALVIGMTINVGKVIVEGLQIVAAGSSADFGLVYTSSIANSVYEIKDCLIIGAGFAGNLTGIDIRTTGGTTTFYISNNIIYDWPGTVGNGGIVVSTANSTSYIYNNTSVDNFNGYLITVGTSSMVLKNNIGHSNTTEDFNDSGQAGGFINEEYNASSDNTATGTGSRVNQTFTFVDEAGNNFLLNTADAGARNFGKNLSGDANLAITTDIIGTLRTSYLPYDIGAHEVQLALSLLRRVITIK